MIGLVTIQRLRHRKSVISKGNVLGYYRNFGSLRYGNEYCVPGRAMNCMPWLLPSEKSESLRLYITVQEQPFI